MAKKTINKEEYDFFKMGQKVAEDSFDRCTNISKRLDEDFGETAKLKFQYGFYKRVTENASSIFDDNMTKPSIVDKRNSKKSKKG